MIDYELDQKIARVSDILEQIEELNKLLDFHKENDADASTIRQYEFMRQAVVNELSDLLKAFTLAPLKYSSLIAPPIPTIPKPTTRSIRWWQ